MKPKLGTFVTALLAGTFTTTAWAQDLGRVHFETSCTPQAQEKFDRGLAMVHSFFYPNSVQAFTEAAAADPQCAIAYWGIAISHRPNPLILPLSAAVLKNGLVLLQHKFRRLCLEALLPQQGHRGRVLMSALIRRMRMVAIELAMWRSGRNGGSPGSITVG